LRVPILGFKSFTIYSFTAVPLAFTAVYLINDV
jgi:hypothetical protein